MFNLNISYLNVFILGSVYDKKGIQSELRADADYLDSYNISKFLIKRTLIK